LAYVAFPQEFVPGYERWLSSLAILRVVYQRWRSKLDVVLRQEHKAGEKMFVDWAGATIPV